LPRVIFVGGDFHRKGGDLLVDVYRKMFRGRLQLHVVTRRGQLDPEPGLNVHIGLTSNDRRLQRLYQDCDLLVIPTRADCFSIAGLEAMSSGLPVITCPIGGVAELFTHGHEGFFVPPDDGRALARALEALIDDAGRRQRMGRAARDLSLRRYDAEVNSRRLFDLLKTLVAKSSRSRHLTATA
jgi:glycosyltransferase involved in cell wall biosynthesis